MNYKHQDFYFVNSNHQYISSSFPKNLHIYYEVCQFHLDFRWWSCMHWLKYIYNLQMDEEANSVLQFHKIFFIFWSLQLQLQNCSSLELIIHLIVLITKQFIHSIPISFLPQLSIVYYLFYNFFVFLKFSVV